MFLVGLLVLAIGLSGCVNEPEPPQMLTCPDGSQVADLALCPEPNECLEDVNACTTKTIECFEECYENEELLVALEKLESEDINSFYFIQMSYQPEVDLLILSGGERGIQQNWGTEYIMGRCSPSPCRPGTIELYLANVFEVMVFMDSDEIYRFDTIDHWKSTHTNLNCISDNLGVTDKMITKLKLGQTDDFAVRDNGHLVFEYPTRGCE